jgi:hypothetical protein
MPRSTSIAILIALNALPIYGVINWGWQSFDLIFLYWLENLIIGVFAVLRMLVRPYRHGIDMVLPLFFIPFFTMHYGLFCLGHGSFIFSLFGPDGFETRGFADPLFNIWPVLHHNNLFWAAAGLLLLQLFDWLRDVRLHGLGVSSVKNLMVAPYRRIVVLHITILASGFALGALDEPVAGLITLVVLKTVFDTYHWIKDEAGEAGERSGVPELTDAQLKQMQAQFAEPEVEINGSKVRYNSFQELRDSKHFRLLSSLMRFAGGTKNYRLLEKFLEMKIAEENGEDPFDRLVERTDADSSG